MRVVGITAEYNPFHKGHRYHLEKSRELTEAEYAMAVMSGDFTQRGEAALADKWVRSRWAVEEGLDLVVELPFIRACDIGSSFAEGAVDILAGLGATHISFGSESGDIEELQYTAEALREKSEEIKKMIKISMKEGLSFGRSLYEAAEGIIGREDARLMKSPNNILALEYLKRINEINRKGGRITAVTVKRKGSGYFEACEETGFAGAGAIRRLASEGRGKEASLYVSAAVARYIAEKTHGDREEKMFRLLRYEIMRSSLKDLSQIRFVGEGMEHRLKREAAKAGSLTELVAAMVSRRYTEAAVKRMLTALLLGIKKGEEDFTPYGRVLAAGKKGRELLRIIKKEELARIPVITNVNRLSGEALSAAKSIETDIHAADMYNLIEGRDLYSFSDRVITPYIEK